MKNILAFLLIVVSFAYAAAPTFSSGVNYTHLGIATGGSISTATGYDTLGAADSATLTSNFVPEKGTENILVNSAITGTGSDSLVIQVLVDALDGSDNLLYRTIADTITSNAGEPVTLPLYGATKYRIKLKTITGSGTQVILNRLYIYARTVLTQSKEW